MFEKTKQSIELREEYLRAIKANDINKVKEVLNNKNASSELIDNEFIHVAPILWSAQEKNWDMVLTLLELNANLDVKVDPLNWYLIHECLVNAPDKIFNNILAYAEYDVKTRDGKTPLMIAIEQDLIERANLLIDENKAVIYEKDNQDRTALHYVALKNNQEMFLKLISKGANVFALDKSKKNPMDLLTDELFRNSIPSLLEGLKIERVKPILENNNGEKTNPVEDVKIEEKEKKISSLSKLTKKK